jgi:hypothetical protein
MHIQSFIVTEKLKIIQGAKEIRNCSAGRECDISESSKRL